MNKIRLHNLESRDGQGRVRAKELEKASKWDSVLCASFTPNQTKGSSQPSRRKKGAAGCVSVGGQPAFSQGF